MMQRLRMETVVKDLSPKDEPMFYQIVGGVTAYQVYDR